MGFQLLGGDGKRLRPALYVVAGILAGVAAVLGYLVFRPPSEIAGPDGAPMRLVPAGSFMMGSDSGEDDEKPVHRVHIDAFYMDRYEVTNERFAKFLNDYGSDKDAGGNVMICEHEWGLKKSGNRWVPQAGYEGYPVVYVTWYGARQYARHYGKRLPTEAEWEKACRAGSSRKYSFGDDEGKLKDHAWYGEEGGVSTHPVGQKLANALGLCDMHGNVWEWCEDWYREDYYGSSPSRNPSGPGDGEFRVLRGGSWDAPANCRSASRNGGDPQVSYEVSGFRCASPAGPR